MFKATCLTYMWQPSTTLVSTPQPSTAASPPRSSLATTSKASPIIEPSTNNQQASPSQARPPTRAGQ